MIFTVDKKIKHLIKSLNFKPYETNEIKKLYLGKPFNPDDAGIKKLLEVSHSLCDKFTFLGARKHKTKIGYHFDKLRRILILRKLFCGRFMLADVRSGINLVIGLVDAPSLTFFNYDVNFGMSLVSMGTGVEIAPKVKIATDGDLKTFSKTGLYHTYIGKDVWLGLGAQIKTGVKIGECCVVGAGAVVEADLPPYSLAVGKPAIVKRKITRKEKETREGKGSPFTPEEEKTLFESVKKWSKISEIKFHKIISGGQFNLLDGKFMALCNATHAISEAINDVKTSDEEKERMLNLLFPIKGENFSCGKNLHVDMLGTAKLGNNVKFGDDVIIGGNVIIGDDVTVDDGVSLFASGHPIYNKRRKMIFSFKYGFVQIGQNDLIVVKSGVKIGKNAIITPGSIVTCDVPDNAIYAKNKIIL